MKLTSLVVGAVAVAVLSGCGSDDASAKGANGGNAAAQDGSGEIKVDIADGTSSSVESAAKQLAKRFEVSGYGVDGSTMTFTFGSAKPDESKLISNCQISTAILDGVAAGEIDTIALKYTDEELTCAELLK